MGKLATTNYDIECDVVIIGYGCAGGIAAITAHDSGANVVILEKMPTGGGTTEVTAGIALVPTGTAAIKYIEAISLGTLPRETIDVFVQGAMKIDGLLSELGGEPEVYAPSQAGFPWHTAAASFPHVAGAECMVKRVIKGTEGTRAQRLWKLISTNVEKRKIRVLYNSPANRLVTHRGQVIGVVADKLGEKTAIRARRGVILTCGGFEYDDSLKWDFLPAKPFYAYGHTGNSGDGIRMAQQVGAALWHMGATSASVGFKTDEYRAAFDIRFISERFIYVDKDGNRFVDEAGVELHEIAGKLSVFDSRRMDYPRIPMYAIFDDVARCRAPLYSGLIGANQRLYKWSPDNSAEIAKGWIIRGKSIKEVAAQIAVNEVALQKTLEVYNGYCRAGTDRQFGRPKNSLTAIESPPYYAIKLWPCLLNTQGGPRRDSESRVLDAWGKPIPRLYAAGELGSIWGFLYQGAGNLSECLVFGQIAGRNAAAETPLP